MLRTGPRVKEVYWPKVPTSFWTVPRLAKRSPPYEPRPHFDGRRVGLSDYTSLSALAVVLISRCSGASQGYTAARCRIRVTENSSCRCALVQHKKPWQFKIGHLRFGQRGFRLSGSFREDYVQNQARRTVRQPLKSRLPTYRSACPHPVLSWTVVLLALPRGVHGPAPC